MEDNILYGPEPTYPLENCTAGEYLYKSLKRHKAVINCMTNAETGPTISYNELLRTTCRLAESFSRYGYPMNTVISICSENSFYFMYPVIAALYAGLVIAPTSHNYTERELLRAFNISKPKIIFCSTATLSKIVLVKRKLPFVQKLIILDSTTNVEEAQSLKDFIDNGSESNLDTESYKPARFDRNEQVAAIMCSSGTTGLPKGVMISHKNLMVLFNHCKDPQCNTANHVKPGGAILSFMPLYHGFAFMTTLEYLTLGYHIIQIQRFKEDLYLSLIEKYKVESIFVVPPIILFLVKSPLVNDYDISSLTEVACGSAPLSSSIMSALQKRLNIKNIRQAYGLTESTMMSFLTPLNNHKYASSGRILPFMAAKITDVDTKKTLKVNEVGEICLKGDMVMKGYVDDINSTKNIIDKDGWLHTGDVGYYDEEGYLYVVDRIKELIKYKGFQVAPAELEALLLQDPRIKDAAVIGIRDEIAGEVPTAFIITQPGINLSEKEVQDFIQGQVAPEKRLRGGVKFIDTIPKNPTGKIMRKQLREWLQRKSKM